MSEDQTVTQADRDAAIDFATRYLYPNSSGVRKALAEAFARHRAAHSGELERLRELLTIAVDEHDNHQGKATLPCHWTNHARTLLGGADDAR